MSDTSKLGTCQMVCWGLAALTGLMVLWSVTASVGVFAGLLLAAAFTVFLGLVFTRLVCVGYGSDDLGLKSEDVRDKLRHITGITGYKAPFDEDDIAVAPKPAQPAPEAAAAPAATAAPVKSGTVLAGEEELATRTGEWTYTPDGAAMNGADPVSAAEDAAVGTRPAALDAPKGGQADDLKQIKGIGPKLEELCHSLGFYHFDQIAAWSADEIAWVDANLEGFKGRVTRDGWVEHARLLPRGETTEFASQVQNDDV